MKVAVVLRSRGRLGSGATCFWTFVIDAVESVRKEVYRVATLTASEHTAIITIAAHQRLLPDSFSFRFGPSILYRTLQMFSI